MSGDHAPERPLDLQQLLEVLARHGVEHVVIGGVAVQVHGHRRTTKDLDLMPAPSQVNHERLAAALAELEAQEGFDEGGARPGAPDAEQLRVAPVVPPLITRHGELQVRNEPKGAAPYSEMRERALVLELEGLEVAVVGLDDLIRMKRASRRPGDLDDIAVLVAAERGE